MNPVKRGLVTAQEEYPYSSGQGATRRNANRSLLTPGSFARELPHLAKNAKGWGTPLQRRRQSRSDARASIDEISS